MSSGSSAVTNDPGPDATSEGAEAPGGVRVEERPAAGVGGLGFALVCLVVAAAVSCVFEVAYLFARLPGFGPIASVPFPIAALVAAVLNTLMVAEARKWSSSGLVHAFPVLVWLLTFVCLFFGPGANMPVPPSGRGLLFLVCGLGAPLLWGQFRKLRALDRELEAKKASPAGETQQRAKPAE